MKVICFLFLFFHSETYHVFVYAARKKNGNHVTVFENNYYGVIILVQKCEQKVTGQ
jgi:hypothetical protein